MDTKIKILIASVLKPVDDVRSFQKIGRSLAQTNKYDVNIIGFKSKKINKCKNISLHPIFKFKRTSILRLTASWKYYKQYLKVKPDIIIVSSPELLIVNFIIRTLFGTPILYDVQENYSQNLKYSSSYSKILKPFINSVLKIVEYSSRYFVSGYLLAERVYERELSFIRGKNYVILENKAIKPEKVIIRTPVHLRQQTSISMIYTGTIGKEYGTLEGIELVKKLYQTNPNISLKIVGYSSDSQYLKSIKQSIKLSPFIQLIGGSELVPHSEIIKAIEQSDIAILPYQVNTNIQNRIPTKFYEYMTYNKPMIVSMNVQWEKMLSVYPAALFIDFEGIKPENLIKEIYQTNFYTKPVDNTIYWDSEAKKLLNFVKNIKLK